MKPFLMVLVAIVAVWSAGCKRPTKHAPGASPTAAAIVEVSGGKQISPIGATLDQPVVVQVNDAQGSPVAGASVWFRSSYGLALQPPSGVTGSDGQFTAAVTLGDMAGRYQLTAEAMGAGGKPVELHLEEIALGLEQNRGRELSDRYCARCHDSESTPERVSNYDNLATKPHSFTDGAYLNRMSDADLLAIISHGGPALSQSAEMPPYGHMFGKIELESLVSYIRAVSDPPYRSKEIIYAQR